MAFSLTNLNTTEIAREAFNSFYQGLAPRMIFSSKAEMAGKMIGDSVSVPFVPRRTAQDNTGATVNYNTNVTGSVNGALVQLTDRIFDNIRWPAANFRPEAFAKALQGSAKAVAVGVQQFVFNRITAANFPNATNGLTPYQVASAGAFSGSDCAKLAARTIGWTGPKGIVLGSTAFGAILSDNQFLLANVYGDSEIVKGGKINEAYGFEVHGDDLIGSLAGYPTLVGIAVAPQAIGVAFAPPQIPRESGPMGYYSVETDEDGKFVVAFKIYYWADTDEVVGVTEVFVGAAPIDAGALIPITTPS